ncbi:MAG: dihydrofolate reductase [Chitinophagales bacterium]|nr:dihydrofolate reductase [Chitinophagales bacterium]
MIISIIVAVSENGVIGKGNKLPWKLSADLKRFKFYTKGKAVIMGRNTYESIGHILPERINIILSQNKSYKPEKTLVFPGISEAINFAADNGLEEVFIIGGANVYEQTFDIADRIYLTKVHTNIEDGDAFFQDIDMSEWDIVDEEFVAKDDKNEFDSTFYLLEQ